MLSLLTSSVSIPYGKGKETELYNGLKDFAKCINPLWER